MFIVEIERKAEGYDPHFLAVAATGECVEIRSPCCETFRLAFERHAVRVFLSAWNKVVRFYIHQPLPKTDEPHWLNFCPWCAHAMPQVYRQEKLRSAKKWPKGGF